MANTITVDWNTPHQTIYGFGASSQQTFTSPAPGEADFCFTNNIIPAALSGNALSPGINLSWCRSMIASFCQATLMSGMTSGGTTANLVIHQYHGSNLSGALTGWLSPPSTPFKVIVGTNNSQSGMVNNGDFEVMKVTGISGTLSGAFSGTTLVCTRAQNGTLPVAHSSGAYVTCPTSAEITTMQDAAARGVSIYALPWSPPAGWKANNSNYGGSNLNTSNYTDMAWLFQLFIENMANQSPSIPVSMISMQNEVDIAGTYETCQYSASQVHDFLWALAPQIRSAYPNVLIGFPEPSQWSFIHSYGTTTFGDSSLLAKLDFISAHDYGISYTPTQPSDSSNNPRLQLWETEWTPDLGGDGYQPDMVSGTNSTKAPALVVAQELNNMLTSGFANGWMWWWLHNDPTSPPDDAEGLLSISGLVSGVLDTTQIAKRAWVIGQWSNWARPNCVRIDATTNTAGLAVSAFYQNPNSSFALMIINNNATATTATISLNNFPPSSLTTIYPYITASGAHANMQPLTPITLTSNSFSYTASGSSVSTLYGHTQAGTATFGPPGGATLAGVGSFGPV